MGIGFSASIFAVPVAGFIYLFLGLLRVFGKSRESKARSWIRRAGIECSVFLGIFVIAYVGMMYLSFRDSGSFEKDPGSGDYWRVPLKYPYQLSMADGLENACLTTWDPSAFLHPCILSGITACALDGNRFIGKIGNGYATYDLDKAILVSGKENGSSQDGITDQVDPPSDLMTVRDFYAAYWKANRK
jgi:hypothetical protein